MTQLKIQLLGGYEIADSSGQQVLLPTRKSWALFSYLASNSGRSIPREELADLLWNRSGEEQARASLRQELANLRKGLAQADWDPINATKDSISLSLNNVDLDLHVFKDNASKGDPESLERAARQYRGTFLKGLSVRSDTFEDWVTNEQRYLQETVVEVLLKQLDLAAAGNRSVSVEAAAKQLQTIDPSNERSYRELMRWYSQNGRRAEALRQYKRCEEALKRELDTSPSPETLSLAEEIRKTGASDYAATLTQSSSSIPAPPEENIARPPASITSGEAEHLTAPDVSKKTARKGWLRLAVSALVLLIGIPVAIGGIQYINDSNRVSRNNLLCTLPWFKAGRNQPVLIGAIMPFEKSFGKRQRWGIQRFFRDRRKAYSFDVKLDLRDSKGDLEQLKSILADFGESKPATILGPMQSRLAYDAKRWGNENSIPIVSSLASASYLATPGDRDFFFRVGMSDGARGRALVDWMQAKNLHNNPYILHEWAPPTSGVDEPEIYGASQATAVKRHLGQVKTLRFLRGDKESQLEAIEQVKNDGRAIAVFGYTSNIKFIIGELQKRGITNNIFMMGVITQELEKENYPFPEKLHVITGIVSEASNLSASAKLRQDFEDENPGIDYDLSAYYSYDATGMVMDAIEMARQETCSGSVTGESVANRLRQTPSKRRKLLMGGFLTDTQEIFFESDGLKIVDGRFQHVGIGR